MAKVPGESKIPVLNSAPLRSRFSNISNKVRSHFDGTNRNSTTSSTLFGIFNNVDNKLQPPPPNRPSSLFKSTSRCSITEKDLGSFVELTQLSKTGILRYFGKTILGPGDWCGIEVESGHGVCDGSISGVRYFSCNDQCALFVLSHLVRLIDHKNNTNDKLEAELMYDDGCPATLANWELDFGKTESPFEGTDSLGILTPDQMIEFKGDEAHYEVAGLFFKMSPQNPIPECICEGDIITSDLEMISMPKDDDLISPVLSSEPSLNHTVSEHDSASAYPKRSTVSFGHVFYDNAIIDRTPSLEDLPMDEFSSKTTTEVPLLTIAPINNVINSITSIGSLDTGYQGDGETSRPTSRGATVKRLGPPEPMTDSDFFTESEAEDHCHRKARVIDGTLYSGDTVKSQPNASNNTITGTVEEMDSSGVYSDFDRICEEPPEQNEKCEVISSNNSSASPSVNSQRVCLVAPSERINSVTVDCTEEASSPASKRYKRPTTLQKPRTLDVRQDQENRAPRTRKPAGRWDAVMNKIEKSKVDQKTHANRLKDVKSKINSTNPLATCSNKMKESPTNTEPLPNIRSHRVNTPLKAKSRKVRSRGGSESNLQVNDEKPNISRSRYLPKSSQNSSRDSSFSDLSNETKIALKQAASHPTLTHKNFNSRSTLNAATSSLRSKPVVAASKSSLKTKRNGTEHNLTVGKSDNKGVGSTAVNHLNNGKAATTTAAVKVPVTTTAVAAISSTQQKRREPVVSKNKRDDTSLCLQRAETRLKHATNGFEAFAIIIKHLINKMNMDAISTSRLKEQLDINQKDLLSIKSSLKETQEKCLIYQEEIQKFQLDIESNQNALKEKDKQINEMSNKKNNEIIELEKRIQKQANDLHLQFDKELVRLKNESEADKMKLILSHDQQIVALQQSSKLEIFQINKSTTEKLSELTEKIMLLECERNEIKSERDHLHEENIRLIEARKIENPSVSYQKLCDEAESLRTVLELKSSEMQELRKQNEKLLTEIDDLPTLIQKLDAAQSRVEDLNVQLQRKNEIEMQLCLERDKMAREIDLEKQKKKRLSCYNEELQWKLKKSTEVANHLAITTKRLSQTPQDIAAMKEAQNNYNKLCKESSNSENSGDEETFNNQFDIDHLEAPAKIMGVMKKNDSLSYVFEVEEEPSEIATRMVRRASSLKSMSKGSIRTRESKGEKRSRASSQSLSNTSVDLDSTYTGNLDDVFGPSNSNKYMSDCFTFSSDSSTSSPEHIGYDQTRIASYIVNNIPANKKTKGNGLTI